MHTQCISRVVCSIVCSRQLSSLFYEYTVFTLLSALIIFLQKANNIPGVPQHFFIFFQGIRRPSVQSQIPPPRCQELCQVFCYVFTHLLLPRVGDTRNTDVLGTQPHSALFPLKENVSLHIYQSMSLALGTHPQCWLSCISANALLLLSISSPLFSAFRSKQLPSSFSSKKSRLRSGNFSSVMTRSNQHYIDAYEVQNIRKKSIE